MKKLAILGPGVVGGSCAEILLRDADLLERNAGEQLELSYVLARRALPDRPYRDKVVTDFSVIERDADVFLVIETIGGCGAALAIRLALKVLGDRAIAVIPPNCMSTVAFIYPHMPLFTNGMIPPFAGTAAVMSGILAGAKAQGLEDYHVVGFAGDGGTADIGLQALSGMIDRNDKAIFICYDNEAYMNTGVQKSGLTPYGMKTTNTPSGSRIHGSQSSKKRMFEIVAAHGIPYAATASLGYPEDYLAKVEKAMNTDGTSYIHVMAPCPTGWGTASDVTVDIGKEAVDCGLWYLAEFENGKFTVNRDPKEFASVEDYLKKQSRFANLDDHDLERIIAERDATWQRIRNDWVK